MNYKVYFVTYGKKGKAPTKIGVTSNLEQRIRALQTSCPYDLKCLASLCFDDRATAYKFEHFIHKKLRRHWIRGEWFRSGHWKLNEIITEYATLEDIKLEITKEKLSMDKMSLEDELRQQILNLRLELNRVTNGKRI